MYYYYYLLYKVPSNPKLWIVNESDNAKKLINKVKKIKSKKEKYYIVENTYDYKTFKKLINNYKFEKFRNYNVNEDTLLIYKT